MEFANLDLLAPRCARAISQPVPAGASDHNIDLALENVGGDDSFFRSSQHFEDSNLPTLDPTVQPSALHSTATREDPSQPSVDPEILHAPCEQCQLKGNLCERIRDNKYKGYCETCVTLRTECSFGLAPASGRPTDSAVPYDPRSILDHPEAILQQDVQPGNLQNTSPSDPSSLTSSTDPENIRPKATRPGPKIGARFSRETVKILKRWLTTHHRHPYPNEEEREMLQKQTGLNKTQITNWLANARHRGKIFAPRSTPVCVRSGPDAIDIPRRPGTPAAFENMNPLQRWQHSPPEHEPASVTDIARAVSTSGLNKPYSFNFTDDGSGRSQCAASSASSVGTSHSSNGSFASALSHGSGGSFGSFGSMRRRRRRTRRKVASKSPVEKTPLTTPLKTFMCTFCTETFKTKHDWQRHEKSLHLSLERWVCAPDGPKALNPENGQMSCVFCEHENPDEAHMESHNYSACQERTQDERTFYRKDHLHQHLKLVHGAKFVNWSMEPWKVATKEIRSRCGFCDITMDTWSTRVEHLAEHFKTGKTMADWKGDWGFEAPVLKMVENEIPPYMIHDERNTPFPYEATQCAPQSPQNAYELIKEELDFFSLNYRSNAGRAPTDEELQVEACRITFGAEVLSGRGLSAEPSWLRDLVLSSDQLALQAQLAPIRSVADSRYAKLKVISKDNIFEDDPMEQELHEYVKARHILGLIAMDSELQVEACNIIARMEEISAHPSDDVANFLLRLIYRSTKWLAAFRQRARLPHSEGVAGEAKQFKDSNTRDLTIHHYSRLETELAEYVRTQGSIGLEPSDAELQKQARLIIYEFDDAWNQTAADNHDWLNAFKKRHLSSDRSATVLADNSSLAIASVTQQNSIPAPSLSREPASSRGAAPGNTAGPSSRATCSAEVGFFFHCDTNCPRRLSRELRRYVASAMSPNNPNCHIPSDKELQHQARWILYESDDLWNQTPADNSEWLYCFKRDVGILTDPSLPGPLEGNQWNVAQDGCSFAPPYVFPDADEPIMPFAADTDVDVQMRDGAKTFAVEGSTTNKYLQAFATRQLPPATVSYPRELEKWLVGFDCTEVALMGALPSSDALKETRATLNTPTTAAGDSVLLGKFRGTMGQNLGLDLGLDLGLIPSQGSQTQSQTLSAARINGMDMQLSHLLPTDVDVTIPDNEITDIQDIDFDFGDLTDLGMSLGM